ncbi:baseplate J/gp47 family protein [Pseudomonas putida]|uniref:Baseplate J/gp47 family protein n=1 Tax=Pseudomonas putida TaxID=303 RepID=A0A6I6XZA3_PSEPU|nr:baseplate J/gp47 family protein [Pseudomonas putida]MBH3449134.1 baseplate J/gp47 family protein [Pseudomonas putida]QHG66762.1 baseplate J/gp47 family protein [Pseudomonas putida]
MPYVAPTFDAIRSRALRDIRALLPDADITSDSDNHVRASSVSAIAEGIHQQASWTARQIFPDTADFEELKKHAASRDVYQKSATTAGAGVSLTGTAGRVVSAASQIRHIATGTMLVTTADVTIGSSGTAVVQAATVDTGASLNGLEGAAVLVSPPLGVDAACVLGETKGGTDDESAESLLARYLDVLRNPPSGGNQADYRRWALSVDGVSTVLVLPKRRGGNTVDLVITSAGGPSSEAIIAACQAYVDSVAPAGADVWVFTPQVVYADLVVALKLATGYTLDAMQAPVQTAAASVVAPLAPLEPLYLQKLGAAISGVAGVVDLNLVSPVANVSADIAPAVGWVRLGSVQLVPLA